MSMIFYRYWGMMPGRKDQFGTLLVWPLKVAGIQIK